jgi:hypothetical protein
LRNSVFLSLRSCMLLGLSSNGRWLQSHRLATGLYATTFFIFNRMNKGVCRLWENFPNAPTEILGKDV